MGRLVLSQEQSPPIELVQFPGNCLQIENIRCKGRRYHFNATDVLLKPTHWHFCAAKASTIVVWSLGLMPHSYSPLGTPRWWILRIRRKKQLLAVGCVSIYSGSSLCACLMNMSHIWMFGSVSTQFVSVKKYCYYNVTLFSSLPIRARHRPLSLSRWGETCLVQTWEWQIVAANFLNLQTLSMYQHLHQGIINC